MLRHVYNLLWYPALPVALAATGARDRDDRRQRLGHLTIDPITPAAGAASLRIWIHAASVGEIEAVRPIAAGLRRQHPHASIVITTMTVTGRDAARRRIADASAWALAPLDCPRTVRTFLSRVRPHLVLITETELWPNYFLESRRAGARIAIVNGRMSRRSLRRYARARSLFEPAVGAANLVLTQTEQDAHRFVNLGAPKNRVFVTGNTKHDFSLDSASELRPELQNFATGHPIVVAGSTAPGEEAIIASAWLELRRRFPDAALVIAPRHPARTPEIEQVLRDSGIEYLRASNLRPLERPGAVAPVLILDTFGELRSFYRRATVAFVGGSINPSRGGQNVAEPAACGTPVLFGPYYENQHEIATALLESSGAKIVRDAHELAEACAQWLGEPSSRDAAGRAAREVAERAGGGARTSLMHLHALTTQA